LAAGSAGAQKNESTPSSTPSSGSGPIQFKMIRLHQERGNGCQTDLPLKGVRRDVCLWVNLEYPEVISAPNEAVRTKIKQAIERWVLEQGCGVENAKTPEMVVQSQIDQERDFRIEEAQGNSATKDSRWLFDRRVKVDYESANVLSLERYEECKASDAQGDEGGIEYVNFRPSTGVVIRLEDIMKPGFEKPLNSAGEVRFRAQYKLAPNIPFKEALFDFPEDRFQLNRNFSVGPEGLTFFYQNGDIGPLARGGVSFFLPYSAFRNLIRPDAHIP
jgi:hypothetical protein